MKKTSLLNHWIFQITFVMLVALILRLPLLNGSFWLDEAAQALESTRPLSQQLDIVPDFQPPLFHLIVHALSYVRIDEWWLRLASLIPGILTVGFIYDIGRKLHNKKTASIASLLLATSSFHIFYSQELRPYALPALFGVISWDIILTIRNKLLNNDKKKKKQNVAQYLFIGLILYTGVTTLGLYASYLYPFLLVSQGCYVIFSQRKNITYLISYIASSLISILLFVPWLPMFLKQLQAGQHLRQATVGWENVVSIPQLKSLPLVFAKFLYGVVDVDLTLLFGVLTLGILIFFTITSGILLFMKVKGYTKIRPKLYMLLTWFIVPIVSAWLVSFFVPVLRPKRVLFCLPALYLIASLLFTYKKKLPAILQHTAFLLLGFLFIFNITSTFSYWKNQKLQREDWRTIVHDMESQFNTQNTLLIFGFDAPFSPWVWYSNNEFDTLTTGTQTITHKEQIQQDMQKTQNYQYVVVFDYLRDLTDPYKLIDEWLLLSGWSEQEPINGKNIGFIRVYTKSHIYALQNGSR